MMQDNLRQGTVVQRLRSRMRLPGASRIVSVLASSMLAVAALGTSTPAAAAPLTVAGTPDLYQRILTLQGGTLGNAPGATSGRALPVFTIMYVFERRAVAGQEWLRVGRGFRSPEGWIAAGQTTAWNRMLVMRFAPAGQRSPALFFASDARVREIVRAPNHRSVWRELVNRAGAGRLQRTGVIATEPFRRGSLSSCRSPYLLPITAAGFETLGGAGGQTRVLQVASYNANARPPGDPAQAKASLASSRMGITFVLDTTASMGPYINEVRGFVGGLQADLARLRLADRVSIGVVGYRNDMDREPQRSRLGYEVRTFHPVDRPITPAALQTQLGSIAPATVSTHTWDEDAAAGLKEALSAQWTQPDGTSQFNNGRLIIVVTDAGMLPGNDPRVRNASYGLEQIRREAEAKGVRLVVVHMQTPEARRQSNVPAAEQTWRRLITPLDGRANAPTEAYIPLTGDSVAGFATELRRARAMLVDGVRQTVAGGTATPTNEAGLGGVIVNEIFKAQLEFIGEAARTTAPTITMSHTIDLDLAGPPGAPPRATLTPSVFLTRNQLSQLAADLNRLLDSAVRARVTNQDFFNLVRAISATTSLDAARLGEHESIARRNVLPSFLAQLPYRSEVLSLTPDRWRALGPTGQQHLIDRLRDKLGAYRAMAADRSCWIDLGAGDQGLFVQTVPLDLLP